MSSLATRFLAMEPPPVPRVTLADWCAFGVDAAKDLRDVLTRMPEGPDRSTVLRIATEMDLTAFATKRDGEATGSVFSKKLKADPVLAARCEAVATALRDAAKEEIEAIELSERVQ